MRFGASVFVFVLACIAASPAVAGFVRASATAILRDEPTTASAELGRLETGDELNLAAGDQEMRNWYRVLMPDGRRAFVSRFRVRRFEGRSTQVVPPPPAPNVGSGLTHREQEFAAFHFAVAGKPRSYTELIRHGYTVGYDPTRKIPLWVQYRLTEARSTDDTFPRTDGFDDDGEVHFTGRALDSDYANSGYDRGHIAPADDMRFDETAEAESNLLTNIAPQVGGRFNSSIWKTLENRVRSWVKDRDDLTIIAGPVFEPRDAVFREDEPLSRQPETPRQMVHNVIGEHDVAVATHFFKVVADLRDPERPAVLAFLMPHVATEPGPERDLARYLVSVDEIERASGLDLLAGLPDGIENAVEQEAARQLW